MAEQYSRHIKFEGILNFRDLGGYKAHGGRTVAWRRVYRSAEMMNMTGNDFRLLTDELGLTSVIDLRSSLERENHGIGLLSEARIKYHQVSFLSDGGDRKGDRMRYTDFNNMGEFYAKLVQVQGFGSRIVETLEIIAEPGNHPLVFHCAIGKDRTGILAGILLSALGVGDKDIIADYTMSAPHVLVILERLKGKPETAEFATRFPAFAWEAAPISMTLLLAALKKEYGSAAGYLKENGADSSLVKRLERALLV
jgi:protein tyrosine/serine phosphatase